MATHDYSLANQSGSSFRTDLNNVLAAIVSNNSASSEPSTKYAYQYWADTSGGYLKIRNAANNAWIQLFKLDGTLSDIPVEGTVVKSTGESGGTKFLREDGDNTCSWQSISQTALTGSTNNTITTVTGANAIQGEANLTFDGTHLNLGNTGANWVGPLNVGTGASGSAQVIDIYSNSDTYGGLWFSDGTSGADRYVGAIQYHHDSNYMKFDTGGSERARIDSSGRLLINTTDVPSQGADTLTVKASDGGNAGITIRTGTGNTGNIFFSDGTSGSGEYAGYIYYAHGTDKLYFGMDSADRLVIGSGGDIEVKTGNVVIGTAGKGIDFSATSGTGTSELFDDYEVGTFSVTNVSMTATSDTYTGRYTKIGNRVLISISQTGGTVSFTYGNAIKGLPFAVSGVTVVSVTNRSANIAGTGYTYQDGSDAKVYLSFQASSVTNLEISGEYVV